MTPKVRKYLRLLKRDFPLRKPVKVRTYPKLKHDGYELHGTCDLISGVYRISLSRNFTESENIETLWHEYVHALLWPRCKYRHSKAFWECYGRIYRHYQDEN